MPTNSDSAVRIPWWHWPILVVVGLAQSIAATAFIIGLFWFCGWGMS